jgi:hypothetical protein
VIALQQGDKIVQKRFAIFASQVRIVVAIEQTDRCGEITSQDCSWIAAKPPFKVK